ncbi:hypothetical protein C8Q79DRAFT_543685 [Trametes meyenii]|nr:hypothetical protein C8Q79DRAFT_543685 [Trametes meyenii]
MGNRTPSNGYSLPTYSSHRIASSSPPFSPSLSDPRVPPRVAHASQSAHPSTTPSCPGLIARACPATRPSSFRPCAPSSMTQRAPAGDAVSGERDRFLTERGAIPRLAGLGSGEPEEGRNAAREDSSSPSGDRSSGLRQVTVKGGRVLGLPMPLKDVVEQFQQIRASFRAGRVGVVKGKLVPRRVRVHSHRVKEPFRQEYFRASPAKTRIRVGDHSVCAGGLRVVLGAVAPLKRLIL